MKKYDFIVLMSGLVLFLFSGLRSIESVKGQDSEDFRTKSVTPIQEQPYFPVNLCLNSIVTEDSKEAGVKPVQSPELLKVIDGDLSTFLNKECNEQSWVAVKFRYRPRWVNQIKIAHGGTVPYVVEYLGLDDCWHVAGTYEASPTPGSPLHSEAFDFNPVKAKAIRWRTVFGESPKGSIAEIYEIEAYFSQTDKGDDGLWEVGVEWVENYPGKKNDRRYSGISATELYNRVGGRPGWSKVFNRGDSRAMEKHFKRRGSWPGGEEDHWIDRVDLAYFHGHGTRSLDWNTWTLRRALLFANWRHDPWLFPSDGKESWGDRDLEWIGFSTCKTMRDHDYWARCMDGLHLILGWETVCYNVIFGKYWADGMIHGPDRRIMQAWFNAADQTHGSWLFLGVPPGVYSSLVIAESIQNLNDGLWGMGVVHPCTPDDYYYCIRHRTVKEEVKGEVFSELLDDLSDPLVLLPSQTEKGMPIKYKSPGLSSGEETTMVMYDVIPRSVDSAYIQNIANSMCEEMGVLCCTTEVEWDGVGHLWMVCGSEGLRVSEASGGVRYINSEWWMSPPSQPPTLLSEAEAIDSANTFLNAIDFLPNDAYFHIVCYPQIARAHKETGEVDPDSSWYTGVEVCYRRETASGYPVVGPGAVLNVTYGDDGRLERWALGGWRDIAPCRPEVPIITVEEAMELIATEGSDATIGGIPYCDTVVVIDAALAYYEENTDEVQDYLEIIWVLASLCISEYDTTEAELFVPARFLPPRGSIDAPPDSSWFAEGDMVTLIGSATGGTPPYTFDWYSDVDGYLGSGNTISTDDLSMICEDGVLSPHTITMIVTDANGSFDYANISLWIGEMTWGNQVIIPNMVYERFGFGHWDYDGEIYVDDACYPYQGINPGDFFEIPILLDGFEQRSIGGFELEVDFDYIDLTFYGAMRGGLLEARYTVFDDELDADIFWSWEYFSYRVLPCNVPACHKYKILLFGLSDMPDGLFRRGYCLTTNPTFPEEYWAEDWAWYEDLGEFVKVGATLVWLKFQVANNELLRDLKLPIAFEWEHKLSADTNEFGQYYIIQDWDCAENTFSSCDGNVLYASKDPLQYNPEICGDSEQNPPLTILEFVDGGVHVCSPCTSFKCVRGDINLDHIPNSTADAVLFARYFVEGIHVFILDRDEQVCATDVNADGRTLMLSDLVYLIRIILQDATAIPKLAPSSEVANVIVSNNTITAECAAPIAAMLFEFDASVQPTLLADMEMVNKENKVLVWSRDGNTITTAEVLSFTGDAELVSVTAVNYDTRELATSITAKVAPIAFALNPAYPNPFNPFTNLSFTLPEALTYSLKIYNVAGQLVRSYDGMGVTGLNLISWDSKDNAGDEVASGIYFYKLTAGSFSATRKMVVLK